jgi:hypothetical protein
MNILSMTRFVFTDKSVCLSGPTSTSFVRFPLNFVEFKIMMCELCSIKDFIVHWVLNQLCLFGLRNFETIQYALCHRKFSYMINQKFMKLCTLQDPNMISNSLMVIPLISLTKTNVCVCPKPSPRLPSSCLGFICVE